MADNTHETKIVINGDATGATWALNKVKGLLDGGIVKALGSVRTAISRVMQAFGVFGLAMQGVQAVIEGYKKLNEWMHRAETAAKALREELAKASYENAVAHAAEAYKKLNKDLAETVRLEKERSAILAARKTTARDIEDADTERRKQLEISRLDPSAANYADQKKEIERRYAIAASDAKAARAREDNRDEVKSLYDQAAAKDVEAARLEKMWRRADANVNVATERRWKAGMEARSGDEDAKKRYEEADKAFNAAVDFAAPIKEAMEAVRKEAESLRRQAAEKTGGNLAANIRNEAEKQKIENDQKAEAAEKKRKDDEEKKREAKEQKTREQNLEDKRLAKMKEESLAELNPSSSDYERQKKEIERTYEIRAAEDKEKRAENETDRQAAKEEREAIGIRHERERAEERASLASGLVDRAASFDGVSQNRLTAMGLGSGVSASGGVASDVKKLVDLLKQQVDESKKLNEKDYSSSATYSE